MQDFLTKLSDLLESDSIDIDQQFDSFDSWDSLTILSIIAWCKTDFDLNLSAKEIGEMKTPRVLFDKIQSRANQ